MNCENIIYIFSAYRRTNCRKLGKNKVVVLERIESKQFKLAKSQEVLLDHFKGSIGYEIDGIHPNHISLKFQIDKNLVFSNMLCKIYRAYDCRKYSSMADIAQGEDVLFTKFFTESDPWSQLGINQVEKEDFKLKASQFSKEESVLSKAPYNLVIKHNYVTIQDPAGQAVVFPELDSNFPLGQESELVHTFLYSRCYGLDLEAGKVGEVIPKKLNPEVVTEALREIISHIMTKFDDFKQTEKRVVETIVQQEYVLQLRDQLKKVWDDVIGSVERSLLIDVLENDVDHEIIYSDNSVRIMKSMDILRGSEEWMQRLANEDSARRIWKFLASSNVAVHEHNLKMLFEVVIHHSALSPLVMHHLAQCLLQTRSNIAAMNAQIFEFAPNHWPLILRRSSRFSSLTLRHVPEMLLKMLHPSRKLFHREGGTVQNDLRKYLKFNQYAVKQTDTSVTIEDEHGNVVKIFPFHGSSPHFFTCRCSCLFAYFSLADQPMNTVFCRLDFKPLLEDSIPDLVPIKLPTSLNTILHVAEESEIVSILYIAMPMNTIEIKNYTVATIRRNLGYNPRAVTTIKPLSPPIELEQFPNSSSSNKLKIGIPQNQHNLQSIDPDRVLTTPVRQNICKSNPLLKSCIRVPRKDTLYLNYLILKKYNHFAHDSEELMQVAIEINLPQSQRTVHCRRSYTKRDMRGCSKELVAEYAYLNTFFIPYATKSSPVFEPWPFFILLLPNNYQISTYDRRKSQLVIVKHLEGGSKKIEKGISKRQKGWCSPYFDEATQELSFCERFDYFSQTFNISRCRLKAV